MVGIGILFLHEIGAVVEEKGGDMMFKTDSIYGRLEVPFSSLIFQIANRCHRLRGNMIA